MKNPVDRGFKWTLLSKSSRPSLHNGATSDIELVQQDDKAPITTAGTYDSVDFRSATQQLSPKRVEDDIAEKLQVDGWRFGASAAAITAGVTATINLIVAAVFTAASASGVQTRNSKVLAEVFHGNCARAATMNTWTHLAINVVSTGLLAGSNYCTIGNVANLFLTVTVQCLVAPNRADIDRAHSKGIWLDIGLPSIRNLRHIGLLRSSLWVLLALSSLPLHLLFNSAFFSSIGDNEYDIVFATPGFLEGASFNYTGPQYPELLPPLIDSAQRIQKHYLDAPDTFSVLDNQECIDAYTADLITTRGSVIVITDDQPVSPENGSVLLTMSASAASESIYSSGWVCPIPYIQGSEGENRAVPGVEGTYMGYQPSCPRQITNGDIVGQGWRPSNITARNCLSETIPQRCGFYANIVILWVVFACNLAKLIVMAYLVWSPIIDKPYMTIGDSIQAFIVTPDPATEKLGPVSIRSVKQLDKLNKPKASAKPSWQRLTGSRSRKQPFVERAPNSGDFWVTSTSQQWWPKQRGPLFGSAASKTRWAITISYFVACLISVGVLLKLGRARLTDDPSIAQLYKLGLGKVSPNLILSGWDIEYMSVDRGVVSSVLVANSPQLALSFLYFAINTLLTLMASAGEWSRFSLSWTLKNHPRTLRTSSPHGDQRRTYFLQLPFRYAVPLIVMSALIHWLISQSIFLAVISQYDSEGRTLSAFAVASCGYSPIGMIFVMIAGSVLMLGLWSFSLFRLQAGQPIVASCSAAISACCHVNRTTDTGSDEFRLGQQAREEMVKGPLVWGEIIGENERLKGHAGAGKLRHCGFVSASGIDWQEKVRHPAAGQGSA